MIRYISIFIALVAILATSGCQTLRQADVLRGAQIPEGGRMDPALWTTVTADATDKRVLGFNSTRFWMLPFNLGFRDFKVAADRQSATYTSFTWNDLGTFFFFLPLRIRGAEYEFVPGQEEAVGKRGIVWTPLWTNSFEEGTLKDKGDLNATGIPLFFSLLQMKSGEGTSVSWFTSLWTLGPFFSKFNAKQANTEFNGYLAAPALLGGLPGLGLWTSFRAESPKPDGTNDLMVSHGPFFGFLGYHYNRGSIRTYKDLDLNTPTQQTETKLVSIVSNRLVIGGILWASKTIADGEGIAKKSSHGPLWGMFGWGRKEGDPTIRLFWMNIKV